MANTSVCNDTSEAVELCEAQGLYLKPVAKINICAQLPQLKTPGKTISNWEVMEKVKQMIRPETFLTIKVVKSTMEFIRLEGEIENKSKLSLLIIRLDGKTIKLSGFPESLKVRAAETKVAFPVRHDWDSYFRDAKNMNEMRPGERPDTIYFQDLPTRWFSKRSEKDGTSSESKLRPSEEIVQKVFETFGDVRCVDIPMLDPYRKEIMGLLAKPGTIQTFHYGQDIQFDAYVQFKEYIGFVKAMDALRGMKLLYKEDETKANTANIKVDFDKTRHLSERMIRKRRGERERLQALEALRLEEARLAKEAEERRIEEERLQKLEEEKEKQRRKEEKQRLKEERRKERAEKRRLKQMEKKQKMEETRMRRKIALEERRLLIAQRKLESLRLLSDLFELVKEDKVKEEVAKREAELEEQRKQEMLAEQRRRLEEEQRKAEAEIQKKLQMRQQEQDLREKIMKKFMAKEQQEKERQREELRLKLSGNVRLKSAVVMKNACLPSTAPSKDLTDPTVDDESKNVSSNNFVPPSSSVKDEKVKEEVEKEDDNDEVEILEDVPEKDVSIIEISSDEGGGDDGGGPSPAKQKASSTMERVLKSNKLRAWGAAAKRPKDSSQHRSSRPRPDRRSPQKRSSPQRRSSPKQRSRIQVQIKYTTTTKKKRKRREEEKNYSDSQDSDSGDSTIMVIPPPRSSFAPPDDPVNFLPPPRLLPSPWWGPPYPSPGPVPPHWAVPPPPPGFRSPPWGRSRPHRREGNGGGSGRSFHLFKEPYLKKYNTVHQSRSREDSGSGSSSKSAPPPKSIASSVSYNQSQKLSRKKDSDGRYMFPLT
ncbi:uncharacterized protein LOC143284250 [Babylonia areolata]|uniref:uncharacterized protein LOC143284250 n=1 Tax=Babylonia areolata TaxID=304850 RepID=UPI003FD21D32